jgi:hypothetical protein
MVERIEGLFKDKKELEKKLKNRQKSGSDNGCGYARTS